MPRKMEKKTAGFASAEMAASIAGTFRIAKSRRPNSRLPEAGEPDPAFAALPTAEPVEAWSGDPRKMRDEDRAFFKLDR
jgi:hypothetical protein